MAARQQKVRLHFLIALTLAMLAFGVVRFIRTYKREQVRTRYAETELELRQYAAELLSAEHKQLEDLAMVQPGRIGGDAAALLMEVRYYQSQQSGRKGPPATSTTRILENIRGNFNRLRAGKPAVFPTGQAFLRAYYSDVDGTFQPYTICVPKGYTGERPYPLIITLHGRMGFEPFQCLGASSFEGAISVQPQGRGATDYMFTGEDDVLAVLEEVCKLYKVDRNRVYLIGTSMGATGCWNLAVHYPHLFGGIVAISGNADHTAWEQRWGWNAAPSESHEWLRSFLHASFSPVSYAENLQYCRIAAMHGTGDEVVPVEHSRSMAARLRKLGYPFEYLEFPQAGHSGLPGWARDYATAKVMGAPAAETPSQFVYKTAGLRHDRAWWLRLDRLGSPVRFSTVSADASEGRVAVSTQNVSALTLLLDEVPGGARLVSVDGTEFPLPEGTGPELRLERWDRVWRLAEASGPLKRKGLSGPFSDVFRDPFLIVYGTAGEPELAREISRSEAERFAYDWKLRYGEAPRMEADSEVTEDDVARFNLVIFGGPDVNAAAAAVAAELPATMNETVAVGGRAYSEDDAGLMICYPNPRNPERMVALIAGTTPAALYQAYARTGLWFDWTVYDEYKWFDYAIYDNRTVSPETLRVAGFFDNQWRLAPTGAGPAGGGAEWSGDPEAAKAFLPQAFPPYRSATAASGAKVVLSDVRPVSIDQYRGAVGLGRSYSGQAIEIGGQIFDKGLGVKVPSSLSFTVGRQFRLFSATVGLVRGAEQSLSPARVAAEGVVFEVWGDRSLLASSPMLNWREADRNWTTIQADVTDTAVLTLKARPASGATWLYGDCAWGAPTLTR